MSPFRALVLPVLASLCVGPAQASALWVLPAGLARQAPAYVAVAAQYHRAVFKVVPGQAAGTELRDLLVYDFYGQQKVMDLQSAAQAIASYYEDWDKVAVEDVSSLVPARGWRWDDANKAREDKLGVALTGSNLTLRDRTFEGYGKLDWGGGGAVVLDSCNLLERCVFRGNAASALRLTGMDNVVRDCTFANNLLRTSDQGQLYQAGRGKGGSLLVEGCDFSDKLSEVPPVKAWGLKTYWRRWGIHIDDGASDVTIKDCTFTGLDGAIDINGGTNILIKNCTFKNCRLDLEVVGNGKVTIERSTFDGKPRPGRTRISGQPRVVSG